MIDQTLRNLELILENRERIVDASKKGILSLPIDGLESYWQESKNIFKPKHGLCVNANLWNFELYDLVSIVDLSEAYSQEYLSPFALPASFLTKKGITDSNQIVNLIENFQENLFDLWSVPERWEYVEYALEIAKKVKEYGLQPRKRLV